MDWEIEYRGRIFPVSVTREGDQLTCRASKKCHRIELVDHNETGIGFLDGAHGVSRADIKWDGEICEVVIDHVPYKFVVGRWSLVVGKKIQQLKTNNQQPRHTAGLARSYEICAPMPCRVVDIRVKPGDLIAAGAIVAVVEAMKMQNELHAPSSGVVGKVCVQKGMALEANQPIVLVEPNHAG